MEVNNFSDTYLEDLNKVDNLMRNKEYDEAIKICNRYIYLDRVKFQSKKISMLIKLNKISEAIKECDRLKFLENNEITFLKIEALYISGRIEEALYICDENSDKLAFVVKKIELLRKQRRLEEALKECNETKFKYSEEISKHREKILYRIEQNRKISSVEKEYKENKEKVDSMISDNISILLTKIYIDDITYNEIKDADIDKWYKDILLIAYYEKHNRIMGLNLIKELKKDYANDKDKIKTLNNLFNRLSSNKNKFFDTNMYSKYLNRNVNFEYALEYTKNKEEVKEEIKEIKDKKQPIISKPVIKKETKTMVEITGKRVNNRYNNLNNQDTPINVINKEVLIKDVFGYELKEVLKYLYVRMQLSDTKRKAIIAWDNLEVLMNNSIKDKESLKKVINLLTIISDNKLLKIDLDKEKVKKYI